MTHMKATLLAAGLLQLSMPALAQVAVPATAATAATVELAPDVLMTRIADALLADLNADREGYRKDPARLRALVDRHLLPHFDTDYAARLVLGKHWRTATEAQRKRFVEAFYQSLMQNYGDALLGFTSDRLKILPYRGEPGATTATVRTEVKRSNGQPVPVNYSLRKTPNGWKAWDVTIEGISYVKNFRTDFGAEIDRSGLDAVIQRLETQQKTGQAPPGLSRTGKAAG
jgi:phospholipid transport system substrate-binding protein